MSKQTRSPRQRLHDILDAIEAIERYAAKKDLSAYRRDVMLRDAVERNLERLSEASRHLPPSLKRLRPETPWRDIADLGNVLRHAYDRVDERIVWDTLKKDLPSLKTAIEALIRHVEKNG
ncbi:MAG: DUF86 domain-containing protein [Alphaproteobacteria bacterium]